MREGMQMSIADGAQTSAAGTILTGSRSMRGSVSARHGHRRLWKRSDGRRCPFPPEAFPLKKR